jgi:hypothetical protein
LLWHVTAAASVSFTGEPGGDVFILMRGELLQLDVDRETTIAKIPEGSVFGETVVLRNLEVRVLLLLLMMPVMRKTSCMHMCMHMTNLR